MNYCVLVIVVQNSAAVQNGFSITTLGLEGEACLILEGPLLQFGFGMSF